MSHRPYGPRLHMDENAASAVTGSGAMTVSEFCDWARIGRTKLYAEIKAGRIVPRKIGAKTLILRSDAEAWLQALPPAA
jgi:excisionase family DNA binding protein